MCPGWMWNGSCTKKQGWSAAQRGALVSVGCRGGTRAGCKFPAYAVAVAEERSARRLRVASPLTRGGNCALGTLAY